MLNAANELTAEKNALAGTGRRSTAGLHDVKELVRSFLRNMNLDVRRYNPVDDAGIRRARILATQDISLVLDVGANVGGYGLSLRRHGYAGRIVSFEPLSDAFATLSGHTRSDPRWTGFHCALGSETGTAEINVAGNSVSSSFLPMLDNHVELAPQSIYIGKEQVEIRRLDRALIGDVANERIFLKLDVQGYETTVLSGAADILPSVAGIEIELSLTPLYAGHPSFRQTIDLLDDQGFTLVSTERGLTDPKTGQILQIDGIFLRRP